MSSAPLTTSKLVWLGLALMAAAVALSIAGVVHARSMSGDFQPIGFMFAALFWGIVLGVAGIACTVLGARQKPRSLATKAAPGVAGLFSVLVVCVVIGMIRIFAP